VSQSAVRQKAGKIDLTAPDCPLQPGVCATQDEPDARVNATGGRLDISEVTLTMNGTMRHTVPGTGAAGFPF